MENDRRLEILGILIIALSVFILVSLLGYNSSEEPSISPNIQIDNPMGILGLITSYLLIKKGFGYVTILLPMIGFAWGWFLFSKKQLDKLIGAVESKGMTLVALNLHWRGSNIKLELALVRGKKVHDKRSSEKDRDWQRQKMRIMSSSNKGR